MKKNYLLLLIAVLFANIGVKAQSASVSPSRLYFDVAPGNYKSQKLRIMNNGTKVQTFTINFSDFSSNGVKGKTTIDSVSDNVHSMANWLTASPSFFEVAPGELKEVEILLQLPNTPEANTVKWAVASVKLARENTGSSDKGENVTGMAIIPTFSFIIHLFQTPPNVKYTEVVIEKFYRDTLSTRDSVITLVMLTKNIGDAIANCASYLDIVNLKTGVKTVIKNKGFTILPSGMREVSFTLPTDMPKGDYNILGVVDYGSETDVSAYELDIKIE